MVEIGHVGDRIVLTVGDAVALLTIADVEALHTALEREAAVIVERRRKEGR